VLHASNRDLERLSAALGALTGCHGDPECYSEADEQFHLALAACTGNPLMIWLYRQINEVRLHAQWAAMRGKVLTAENMRLYDRQHAAVVEAVRQRDADAAAAAMVEQMAKARADLLGAQSR
jgi:DNA-binding FadR family transcriptional regulator